MPVQLKINGEQRESNSNPLTPLVDVLRDEFFLTGAKVVCREGFCGACMVLLDRKPVVSCLMPAGLAAGGDIRTVEALAPAGTCRRCRALWNSTMSCNAECASRVLSSA
jgi:carbon-monoxide dehydrogenase small subunit